MALLPNNGGTGALVGGPDREQAQAPAGLDVMGDHTDPDLGLRAVLDGGRGLAQQAGEVLPGSNPGSGLASDRGTARRAQGSGTRGPRGAVGAVDSSPTLQQLRAFCDLALTRSFSQTARRLGVSQPAVTQAVRRLERAFGTPLLDRAAKPPRLLPSGQRCFEACSDLINWSAAAAYAARCVVPAAAEGVSLAASDGVGSRALIEAACCFGHCFAPATLKVDLVHPASVYAAVLEGRCALGVTPFAEKHPGLRLLPLSDQPLALACHPRHHLADVARVTANQLRGETFVMLTADTGLRRAVDRFLEERHLLVDVALECHSVEVSKRAVAAGTGVALLPRSTVIAEAVRGDLVLAPLCSEAKGTLAVVHRRDHALTILEHHCVGVLRCFLAQDWSVDAAARSSREASHRVAPQIGRALACASSAR